MRNVEHVDTWDARPADRGFMAALAALAFMALGLELVADGSVLTLTGEIPTFYPIVFQMLFWAALGATWFSITRALVAWSRHRGLDPLPSAFSAPLSHTRWSLIFVCFIAAILAAIVLPVLIADSWSMTPVRVYFDLYRLNGPIAWLPMITWLIYHVGRACLLASFLAYTHRAVRIRVPAALESYLPWGGMIVGVILAAVTYVSAGPAIAVASAAGTAFLGMIYVLTGESLRSTAIFAVLIYLFF